MGGLESTDTTRWKTRRQKLERMWQFEALDADPKTGNFVLFGSFQGVGREVEQNAGMADHPFEPDRGLPGPLQQKDARRKNRSAGNGENLLQNLVVSQVDRACQCSQPVGSSDVTAGIKGAASNNSSTLARDSRGL